MNKTPIIAIDNLNVFYGAAQIIFNLSLELKYGQIAALMGRNGAGKSTTLKAVMGLVACHDGTIAFRNQPIDRLRPYERARLGLGFVPEDRRVFSDLTVLENLAMGKQSLREAQRANHYSEWTPERLFDLFPNLASARHREARTLSGGEQQMLTVARTLMGNPVAILLDEPSEGVAPIIVDQIAEMILSLREYGIAILLSEQNFFFSTILADWAFILEKGELQFSGPMQSIRDNEPMRRAWLEI